MITVDDYFMGRRSQYASDMTPEIEKNAAVIVDLVNQLIERARSAGVVVSGKVNSGWRPPSVNAKAKGAAAKSKHITGQAIDLADSDGALDAWLMTAEGQKALADIGLWHEHPSATPTWAHVQSVPPGSGKRTFYP